MLQIHHLKKSYNKKTEVLSDIDYTFEEGRVYPVLGVSVPAGQHCLTACQGICRSMREKLQQRKRQPFSMQQNRASCRCT